MLTICPTPIGNLEDVTPRQLAALSQADVIACEDTRVTGKLLEALGVAREQGRPRLLSYHEHNAAARLEPLLEALERGERVTLVSDAGTPTISDPGYRLVSACHEREIAVTALPGAVAAMVALSASGLPTDRFYFEGFLPAKAHARRERLGVLRRLGVTTIAYESPHRLLKSLTDLKDIFGPQHPICVARELTKRYEEYRSERVEEALEHFLALDKVRGEFVLVIAAAELIEEERLQGEALHEEIDALLKRGLRTKQIREALGERSALSRSELYALIAQRKQGICAP